MRNRPRALIQTKDACPHSFVWIESALNSTSCAATLAFKGKSLEGVAALAARQRLGVFVSWWFTIATGARENRQGTKAVLPDLEPRIRPRPDQEKIKATSKNAKAGPFLYS